MASIWEKLSLDQLIAQGFPESTARKIKSGELPMDRASREARALEQGHTVPVLHVGKGDLNELDPNITLFATDEPVVAAGYVGRNPSDDSISDTTYPLLLNPSNYASFDAANLTWHGLDESPADLILPSGQRISLDALTKKHVQEGIIEAEPGEFQDEIYKTTNEVFNAAKQEGASGVRFDQVQDLGGNFDAMMEVAQYTGQDADVFDDVGKTVFAVDPATARSPNAAFDPENIGKPILMGIDNQGSPSLIDRATGAAATVGDIATQTWDEMSLLDKAALVTSPIPFVGAGTGIAADVMNMVNNPEERTFLNAALLASNFIPGNKIAGAGMAMAEAGKKNFRKIVDTFQKVPEADRDALTAAFDQVEARIDQLRAKDNALKSNAQRRDDRYSKPQNLSESELAEYNSLMERSVNASMAGRMGKTSEEILKELRGE